MEPKTKPWNAPNPNPKYIIIKGSVTAMLTV
jgi:hypothetical protein